MINLGGRLDSRTVKTPFRLILDERVETGYSSISVCDNKAVFYLVFSLKSRAGSGCRPRTRGGPASLFEA